VSVNAVVDMNSVQTVTEKYEPKGVATKEEITTGSETGAGTTQASGAAVPGSVKKDETIMTEYEVGKTVTQETVLPGKIKSLSVAAVVDLSNPDPNAAGAGGQPAKIMDPNQVEQLIVSALSLDLAGSDSVTVLDVPMAPVPESLVPDESSGGLDFVAIARQGSLGIMAICALLVMRMFRGAKKKTKAEAAEQLSGAENTGLLPGETGESGPLALRNQVTTALKQDPDRVKQLFTSWIEDKD